MLCMPPDAKLIQFTAIGLSVLEVTTIVAVWSHIWQR